MAAIASVVPVTSEASVVYQRARKLGLSVVGPFHRMTRRMVLGFACAAVLALIAGLVTGRPMVALLVGVAASVVAGAIAWRSFFDDEFRQAVELTFDHDCHERAEWKAENGTSIPRNRAAMNRWLLDHPTSPGRASLLIAAGRLDEADAAIDAMTPSTPEQAFNVEVLRRTRMLYAGEMPDLADLHAAWRALPDPRERRHRRECLAVLEAFIAADLGADPMEPLARGRREAGQVHWSMRAPWLLVKWSSLAVLGIASATIVTALVSG